MLNNTATSLGLTIGNNATSRGIQLGAMPGTPLKALVTTLATVGDAEFQQRGGEALAKAAQSSNLNPYNHEDEKQELVRNIRTIVENKTLRTIQEDLNPLIRDIRTEVSRQRVAIAEENALGLDIVMHELSPVYTSSYIENLVITGLREQRTSNMNQPLRRRILADLSIDSLGQAVATPSAEINAQVLELIQKHDESSVDGIISDLLNGPVSGVVATFNNHAVLVSYLLLRGVQADKHPYIKLDSLNSDERLELSRAVATYQYLLSRRLADHNRIAKNNTTFLAVEGKKMHVVASQYMAWTEKEENTKEAVFGAIIRHGARATDVLRSGQNLNELEKAYKNHAVIVNGKTNSLADSKVEEITRNFILRHFNEEAETSNAAKESLSTDIASVRDYFNYCRKDKLTSDEEFITRAVCKTVGRGIDAEVVILEMQRFLEQEGNEDLELQVALQYAVTCLLARYMARQTTTEKVDLSMFGMNVKETTAVDVAR